MTTLRLWWLLRRRAGVNRTDPARMTGMLAVIAFAVTTCAALVVLGGFLAFWHRAQAAVGDNQMGWTYVLLAGFASLLLLVPVSTLGGAAARLAMARRDERLAALRLAGATTAQVSAMTIWDALFQAVIGGLVGIAGYLVLIPVVAQVQFQGRGFEWAELWVGVPVVAAMFVAVLLIATMSAVSSLARVAITPLGVASRVTPPGLKALRLLSLVAAFVAVIVVTSMSGVDGMILLVILMFLVAGGMATLNLVGPFVLRLVGLLAANTAQSAATLLAGRRIADDPLTAWRSVGGVSLATFIAGITAFLAMPQTADLDPQSAMFVADLGTGGILALVIAGIVAGVSTGVMQAGRIIDQRHSYRNLLFAGADQRTLTSARIRETVIPLVTGVGLAAITLLVLVTPIIGMGAYAQVAVLVRWGVCTLGAAGLVVLGAMTAGLTARRMVHIEA